MCVCGYCVIVVCRFGDYDTPCLAVLDRFGDCCPLRRVLHRLGGNLQVKAMSDVPATLAAELNNLGVVLLIRKPKPDKSNHEALVWLPSYKGEEPPF